MLRTLFFIPTQVAGVPLFGFGLLSALWLVLGGAALWRAYRRKADANELINQIVVIAVGTAVLVVLIPAIAEPEGIPIRGYGTMMLAAVLAAVALAAYRSRARGWNADLVYSLAFWAFVPGIVGARAFYVIEYWSRDFAPAFQEGWLHGLGAIVNVTRGGLVVFGSLLGALAGMAAFAIVHRLPLLKLLDLVIPSLALGQAIGRVGCFLNGCCFGGLCALPWAISFPVDSPPYLAQLEQGLQYGILLGEPCPTCGVGGCQGKTVDHAASRGDSAYGAGNTLATGRASPSNNNGLVVGAAGTEPTTAVATVVWINENSPLARAGITIGDRLRAIDGRRIDGIEAAADVFRHLAIEPRPVEFLFEGKPPVIVEPQKLPAKSRPVHPTQLYSAIDAALLCVLLLAIDPYLRYDGLLFALGLGLHAVSRFLLEIIRTDEAAVFGTGLSISQNISLAMLLAALILTFYTVRRGNRIALVGRADSSGACNASKTSEH